MTILLTTICYLSFVAGFVAWFMAHRAMFTAAKNRLPSVEFFDAMNSFNLLFNREYYNEIGQRACKRYVVCFAAFFLSAAIAVITGRWSGAMH